MPVVARRRSARVSGSFFSDCPSHSLPVGMRRENRVVAIGHHERRVGRPIGRSQTVGEPREIDRREHDLLHVAGLVRARETRTAATLSGLPADDVVADDESLRCDRALKVAAIGERHRPAVNPLQVTCRSRRSPRGWCSSRQTAGRARRYAEHASVSPSRTSRLCDTAISSCRVPSIRRS